ncbi:hypothetical protein BY996DRAFT_6470333 [Phakopsora pachyrhizi]|nr:hypothetical protein BY996DRAFT_6470333 [Phakopsora pachyrhizi]
MPEEGLTQGRNRRKGDVDIAGPTTADDVWGRARGACGAGCTAGGRREEVSVGLVRRRETPHQRRTDIGGISRTVVGRALGVGRRARRRHTEVRSSYHFRVGTK